MLVVGNGAVGSSIAFELASRGLRVAKIGPRTRDLAASTAAGAMLGCFGEVTRLTVEEPNGRAKLGADLKARSLWPEWIQRLSEFGSGDIFSSRGTAVVLNTIGTHEVDTGNFGAIKNALEEHREPYEGIDPKDIPWYNPDELSRALSAIYIPGERSVHVPRLLGHLDEGFRKIGGSDYDAFVTELIFDGDTCQGVRLNDGRALFSSSVVLAAGASSLKLLESFPDVVERIPPMFSGYGVSMIASDAGTVSPQDVIRTPNRAFACGLHSVPRTDSKIYVGGTNVLVNKPREFATIRDLEFLLNCAVFQLNRDLPKAAVERVQVGNRPVPADGFPLVGEVGLNGVVLATGTYRDGLHQSPLLATYVADLLQGVISEADGIFKPFTPVRRPLQIASRGRIIEMATDELIAAAYETHWNVRPEWPDLIRATAPGEFERKADRVHGGITPPPDVLAKMDDAMESRLRSYYAAWADMGVGV